MSNSLFAIVDTWDEAENDTSPGLMPLSIRLLDIPDEVGLPVDRELTSNYHQSALLAMTTVFTDEEHNGKLGWVHITIENKDVLGNLIEHRPRQWYFIKQTWESEDA